MRLPSLRLLLALSRPAGLPTIWSNCLAGWWLGGGGNPRNLAFLLAAATLLYLGGTWLNDAFAGRLDRPRSGAEAGAAFALKGWSAVLLALGAVALFRVGALAGALGLALLSCIALGRLVQRLAAYSFLLPALYRLLLYLIAASAGMNGVTGWAIWCGLALALYILGVDGVQLQQNRAGPLRYWPTLLLAAPIFLALIMDDNGRREAGLLLSAVLALWTIRCLRPALWSAAKDFAGAVPGLVSGIVFVDLLAVADAPKEINFVFLLLFGATRLLQRPGAA